MKSQSSTCYDKVTLIAEDYFGPAAPRVMGRLISNHLHKEPTTITQDDLPALTKWTQLAVALITEDKDVVDEFIDRLNALAHLEAQVAAGEKVVL